MSIRITRLYRLLGLAILLVLPGCFPSSFELAAERVIITDATFTQLYEDVIREEGETPVLGRTIEYRVDNYAGLWANSEGVLMALVASPSVPSMTLEANPVSSMGYRQLADMILQTISEYHGTSAGIPNLDDTTLGHEEFARFPTSLGTFDGSRFSIENEEVDRGLLVLRERHGEDLIVILVLFDQANESQASDAIHGALETLQHPAPSSAAPEEAEVDGRG